MGFTSFCLRPGFSLVVGERGSGKTGILAAIGREAREQGSHVIMVGMEPSFDPRFAGWAWTNYSEPSLFWRDVVKGVEADVFLIGDFSELAMNLLEDQEDRGRGLGSSARAARSLADELHSRAIQNNFFVVAEFPTSMRDVVAEFPTRIELRYPCIKAHQSGGL